MNTNEILCHYDNSYKLKMTSDGLIFFLYIKVRIQKMLHCCCKNLCKFEIVHSYGLCDNEERADIFETFYNTSFRIY